MVPQLTEGSTWLRVVALVHPPLSIYKAML
jgi:hypothetical protein